MSETEVIAWLETEMQKAIDDGFATFISGMARGVDIWQRRSPFYSVMSAALSFSFALARSRGSSEAGERHGGADTAMS